MVTQMYPLKNLSQGSREKIKKQLLSNIDVIASAAKHKFPGAKLNAPCATRRVDYKDVIYNLMKIAAVATAPSQ